MLTPARATPRPVSQRLETSLHVGTHLDGPMHAADGAGDIASLPLTKLVREGVIVDVSDRVEDGSIITPKHITDRMEVKRGDILILHTGYHRYHEGKPQQDLTRDFCMHPGGTQGLAQWMHDMQIAWWGIDAGSGDHAMNTTIRYMRPDLTRRFEEKVGRSVRDFFGEYEYGHHKSGRMVKEEIFPMHYLAFLEGCLHAENVGGCPARGYLLGAGVPVLAVLFGARSLWPTVITAGIIIIAVSPIVAFIAGMNVRRRIPLNVVMARRGKHERAPSGSARCRSVAHRGRPRVRCRRERYPVF